MNLQKRNRGWRGMFPILLYFASGTLVHVYAAPQESALGDRAQPSSVVLPSEDLVSDLLRVLDEETEIATRTKLNIDFVPGMVTVLHGKDLLARGVRTVYEALGLVPGVELSMAGDGQYQFLVRGLGKTFASTKAKFLINGVDLNSTLGPVATVHTIPIEQVDRIEVVRGPGSAIYGEYAQAGVVDVITLDRGNNGFARYGDVDGGTVGVTYGYHPQNSKVGFSINFAAMDTEGGEVKTGKDKLSSPQPAISNAPGSSNERESNNSAILRLNYSDSSLYLQHVRSAFGDHFGVVDALPDESSKLVRRWNFDTVEMRNPWRMGRDARAEVRLGWTHFVTDLTDQQLYPAGFKGKFLEAGVLGGPHYEETRTTLKTAFEFPIAERHYGVAGAEYADVRQGDTWIERNYTLTNSGGFIEWPMQRNPNNENWLQEGLERRILSAYLQDQYTGVDRLTVTAGVRVDHYNDVGNAVTPRIGGVYQLSSRQTLKLQYSDSFRPPSFLELYSLNNPAVKGNSDIEPERMHNLEAGYAYNNGQHIFRATAFASEIKDIIALDANFKYQNGGEAYIRGIELEGSTPLLINIKLDGNVSIQHNDTQDGQGSLWGAAQRLANVGLMYQVMANRFVNVQYRYVGRREREAADTRSALAGYQTFDLTFSADKCLLPELNLRVGIRNVLDADVVYPAPKLTYPDDYPRPGRQWWLAASYKI